MKSSGAGAISFAHVFRARLFSCQNANFGSLNASAKLPILGCAFTAISSLGSPAENVRSWLTGGSSVVPQFDMSLPDLSKINEMMRSDLEHWSDWWFTFLKRSTALVVIGIVCEGPEVYHAGVAVMKGWSRWISHRWNNHIRRVHFGGWDAICPELRTLSPREHAHPANWIAFVGLLGWILVVVGVAGEGVAEYALSDAENNLRVFNNATLAETQRSAMSAAAAASIANTFATRAMDASRGAIEISQRAHKEADAAKLAADRALKDASLLEAGLIEISPREVAINRSVMLFKSELGRFSGQTFRIAVCPPEDQGVSRVDLLKDEVVSTTKTLTEVLVHEAGWKQVRQPNVGSLDFVFPDVEHKCDPARIRVYAREGAPESTRRAGQALQGVIDDVVSDNVKFSPSVTSDNRKYQGQPEDVERNAVFIIVGINWNALHPDWFKQRLPKKEP